MTDITWTLVGRRELPDGASAATALVAGASAALSLAVAVAVDE